MFVSLANVNGLPLLADPDSHWHITVGNWILQHGAVPTVDSYSFTFAGQPWIAKEWLSQVLMALAYDVGGWGGVVALGAAAFGVTLALLLRLLLRDLRPLPALMFTAAAFVMMAPHFLARPFALGLPVHAVVGGGPDPRGRGDAARPSRSCCSPCWFWANLHGGFTLGLLLGGAFALEALVGGARCGRAQELFVAWAEVRRRRRCWSPASRPMARNRSW